MALILSVCIPVYHASATIDRCLAAVARQLPSEAEILLVDNASKDDTVAVARRTLTAAPNVQVVIQDRNVGRVANWNRCLELATGRYVKFALANDVLMNGAIALLLAEARRHPDAVMICSRAKFVDTTSDREMVNAETAKSIRRDTAETLEFFGRHGFQTGGLNGMLYRREPLIEHGIFFREDLPYCADYYLAIQLAAQGPSVFLDTETYMFDKSVASRFHFAGKTRMSGFFAEQRECARLIRHRLKDRGKDGDCAFEYLAGQYLWYLGQGASLTPADAFRTFAGLPGTQMQMVLKTIAWRLQQDFPRAMSVLRSFRARLSEHRGT